MSSNIFKRIRLFIKTFLISFKLSYRASPVIMYARLLVLIISTFVPFINSYSLKCITDGLIKLESDRLLMWFALLATTQIIMAVMGRIVTYLATIHNDKISRLITTDIIDKVNDLDISFFDNAEFYDEISNVTNDTNAIPVFVWSVLSIFQTVMQFVSAFFLLIPFGFWVPIILCLTCIPNFLIDRKYSLKLYKWSRVSVNDIRHLNYSYDVLVSKYFSKDLRVNRLTEYMRNKYINQWNNWFLEKKKILDEQFFLSFLLMLLPQISTLCFAGLVLNSIINGLNTVGDFAYFIGIMGQLTSGTMGVITAVSNVIEQNIKIENYDKFTSRKPLVVHTGTRSVSTVFAIEFCNVSFCFPGTDKMVLKDISFTISGGEHIGIVGKNGSGKTTIINLILRLYIPTKGEIKLNGININDYELESYYKLLSVMMQDYINYSFTLRENISTADIDREPVDESIIAACKASGAYSFVKDWDDSIDTYLTKSFDSDGVELSGGQWQKIALARLFYKKAAIYIMDEPSASLDIESEYKIFNYVLDKLKNTTLILISHQLQNLSVMDRIFVMDEGCICESGTHLELMEKRGTYYQLYQLQCRKRKSGDN